MAERRAAALGLCGGNDGAALVRFVRADAAALPFPDGSFDTVLDTFSLCVLGGAAPAVLAEVARVLRPAGRALLLEHSRSGNALLGAYQDATAGAVAAAGKGCAWNQDVAALLDGARLRVLARQDALGGTLTAIEAARADT